MGIPTSDGPDFIINKLRDDVTTPWSRPLAAAIVGAWLLFVLVPYLFGETAGETLARWSILAAIGLALTFAIPPLVDQERYRAGAGTAIAGAVLAALVWAITAG